MPVSKEKRRQQRHVKAVFKELLQKAEAENCKEPEEYHPVTWKEYNFDPDKGVKFLANNNAVVRMYYPLPDTVTTAERGIMFMLSRYLTVETGMLGYRSNTIYKPYTVAKLAQRLEMNVRYLYRVIAKMEKMRVLVRERHIIYLNPIYFYKGRFLNWHLYHLFQPELDKVLPKWVVDRFNGRDEEPGSE